MIRASSRDDHGYYAERHMALVAQRLGILGHIRLEIGKGVTGGAPGVPAPFMGIGHLSFNSVNEFRTAVKAHRKQLTGDVPNFTGVQISEIVG